MFTLYKTALNIFSPKVHRISLLVMLKSRILFSNLTQLLAIQMFNIIKLENKKKNRYSQYKCACNVLKRTCVQKGEFFFKKYMLVCTLKIHQ